MSATSDLMQIKEELIRAKYTAAQSLLDGFDHTPRLAKQKEAAPANGRSSGIAARRRFRSTTPGLVTQNTARPEGVHLIDRIEGADDGDTLTSPTQAHVLRSLRRALATSMVVADQYAEQTGLAGLLKSNLQGALPDSRKTEFSELLAGSALISLHVFANMTAFLLSALQSDGGEINVEIGQVQEVLTDNAHTALSGALWELDQDLAVFADDESKLVPTVKAFLEQLMDKVALRASNMPRLEPFTSVNYRVEDDDFQISGFTPYARSVGTKLTMTFKKPNEVVGNHIAKYQAMKLSKMLMAYDFDRKLNPFADLGGFIFTFMGDGAPGTGKTTLIQMMAGLISGYCENAGYPFRYQNLSTDSIDSYQGKSAQNAKAFFNTIIDPAVIGFGTIDDIDQLAGKRGDRQSSAGQLEITAVLMESFAGANTVVRGNCTFGMFSNYPENVDDALRQRAGARFLVDGPQSRDDYIDILHLLMGKNHNIPTGKHDLFAAQHIKKAVAESYQSYSRPKEEGLIEVFDAVSKKIGKLDTIAKLGTYLKGIQDADERFTGRAIKNITDAVKVRAMDFELPDEWMENPELFLFKDYDTKRKMIADMSRPITVDMLIQEINRYADSEFRYADKSDEIAIDNMVRDFGRQAEAKSRYLGGEG
ncbi:ATP-binding protein [Robiginitomaculum antarcticum]|uniref:ATP-binding protein n=1 Tax=Robiginitomaculum antarcticum TaxID=437507 RepID=UPI00039DE83B|nr:ATP-binding protein [Robiginitomaculum antarcticum]